MVKRPFFKMKWSLPMNKGTAMLNQFMQREMPLVEKYMMEKINEIDAENTTLIEAMRYSLNAGGKRIRPLLLLSTLVSLGGKKEDGYDAAAALECVHTYSLIHDDLPAMDDDHLRRGKPTNHIIFGEAVAILTGDGLLTQAFQILADSQQTAETKVLLIQSLAQAAGPSGMVAGQVADMEGEQKSLSLEDLKQLHRKKTGALLKFAVYAGCLLSGSSQERTKLMDQYAEHLGLAFQIRDDILDIIGTTEALGKETGMDEAHHKSTYPSLLGLEGAKHALQQTLDAAEESLKKAEALNGSEKNKLDPQLLQEMIYLFALPIKEEKQ